jgi:uncharacterized membrane protein HdeD (DUF308 family)
MTEPQTGPPGHSGSGGQQGDMPAGAGAGMGLSGAGSSGVSGPGSEPAGASAGMSTPAGTSSSSGSGSSSGIATAKRTSQQTSVPQQLGHQQERMAGETEMESPGLGSGVGMMQAAARSSWAAVLLGALAMVGLGIALLVWPHASLTVVAILIGAAVVVSGLVRLYEGFTARGESGGMRTAYVVIGLVAVVAGIYLLRHHALSLFLIAFVTGVYFIMHGISDLGVAFSADVPYRGLRGVLGVFSLAAGILMIVWPGITLVLLLTLVAAWLIFYGIVLGALSFGLRRVAKEPASSASMPSGQLAASTR